MVQGQHRAVSPGDVTKTLHFSPLLSLFSGLTLFLAFAVQAKTVKKANTFFAMLT